ncbi:hypothetical protein BBO_08088 [Beauveria brongniartii RCEF 3172]|uniref:Uncharacterized protein n=1 Tax=Beauveria brongniartii RCEF 3172 TaxID=1081107 RepID=A0A166Y484_9HYPO|nr:hypothetical protein BBO_08088 [Beauveria brongniartii RCEF 3172]
MAVLADEAFWSTDGPRFDFTIKFEDTIFSLGLSGCLVIASVLSCFHFCKTPIYVRTTALLWTKLSVAVLLICTEIAFLGVKVTLSGRRTNVTLTAAAIDLLASL